MGVRKGRWAAHCRSTLCLRLVQLSDGEVNGGEVAEPDRVGAVHRERSSNEIDGRLVVARLMHQHPQEMQGLGMLRDLLQDAPVQGFGVGQVARAMVLEGQGQALGDRERAWRSRRRAGLSDMRFAHPFNIPTLRA